MKLALCFYSILIFASMSTNIFSGFSTFFSSKKSVEVADKDRLPIVFHPKYDIGFFGIENLHPFDSKKYGKVARYIQENLNKTIEHFYRPQHNVLESDLEKVHSKAYLKSLALSRQVAGIAEISLIAWLPNSIVQKKLLDPMRLATQGTIDAAFLALEKGIGINLSGGYHHAKKSEGSGFCVYADIPLAIHKLREQNPDLKVMYIDLDAHQGNGVGSCLADDANVYIFDCYNQYNWPRDWIAGAAINKAMTSDKIYCATCKSKGLAQGTCLACNDTYLTNLKVLLPEALQEFESKYSKKPDIIFYNAGTDPFEEDVIGWMKLTKQGIIDRDQYVFEQAKQYAIPLCMTLSGGYSAKSADIIGSSIVNLWNNGLLTFDNSEKEELNLHEGKALC